MSDNYKDFDERFRTMLENAEEDVPPQLADNVFSRLDAMAGEEERRRVLPLWLRRISAVTAAAAAVLLAVVLWPGRNEESLVSEDIAIDKEKTGEALADVVETHQDITAAEDTKAEAGGAVSGEKREASGTTSVSGAVKVTEDDVQYGADLQENAAETQDEADPETPANVDDEAQSIREDIDNEKVADDVADSGDGDDELEYIDWEEPNDKRSAGKAAIVLNGDLSSNGNARSLSRFSGLRAPAAGVRDRTWIEQTGKDSRYAIPVSVGIGARYQFTRRWSVGAGINYTLLSRTFSGVYTKIETGVTLSRISTDIRHNIHYIGIPVNVYYNILDSKRVKFYAYGGGALDFPVSNIYRVKASTEDIVMKEKTKGVQYSLGAGVGVEFMLANHLGLYLDPGFRYYFDNDQPVSIRTQQPFMMNFELGFRFDI
ncbi:MAG: outer membrane beta-barrel protein [Candidatus Cryptobacteroides sp.]